MGGIYVGNLKIESEARKDVKPSYMLD
jgi:hypothetical protein